jgi:hypothetical protein
MGQDMSVWSELKRRKVIRVAAAYAIGSWLLLQLTDVLRGLLGCSLSLAFRPY